ncbi:unnamed protein product [Prunus brigantina]
MAMVAEKNILKDKGMKGTVAVFEKGSSSSSKSKPKGKDKGKKKKGFLKPKEGKITKKSKEPKGTCFHLGKKVRTFRVGRTCRRREGRRKSSSFGHRCRNLLGTNMLKSAICGNFGRVTVNVRQAVIASEEYLP